MTSAEPRLQRYVLELEFDGKPFCGWQMQSAKAESKTPSIQGTLERSLQTVLHSKGKRIVIQGCGRTDTGVHAEQFFAHFDVSEDEMKKCGGIERVRHKLNSVLPNEVVALRHFEAPKNFHALNSVVRKTYEYRILQRRAKPTLALNHVYWLPQETNREELMDWSLLKKGLELFKGEHDFLAFASKGSDVKTTKREIYSVELNEELKRADEKLLFLRFCGNGFLKQQIRNMVGTLLELGQGKRKLKSIEDLLSNPQKAGGREAAGYCVPPDGLFLVGVEYEEV